MFYIEFFKHIDKFVVRKYNYFMNEIKPNAAELKFLNLAYSRFFYLLEIINDDNFFNLQKEYRFFYITNIISIYSELLAYEPIAYHIKTIRENRPPMEAEISSDLFKFIRNIFVHFPVFSCWNEVWIDSQIITWSKKDGFINKFLKKYVGHKVIKYRMWLPNKKKMIYVDIKLPNNYMDNKIYLKDIIDEKNGIIFLCGIMQNVLDSQIEK